MTHTLPTHVQAILEGDYGVEECFEIMRAARIKAEHELRSEPELASDGMAGALHELFQPLNDLSDELEGQIRRLQARMTGTEGA